MAIVGPILPFRGGIAQHTTMLLRAFETMGEARAISFSRQYPAILFPGQSDRDPGYADYAEPNVHYLIDSLNPLTWYAAANELVAWRPDVVVMPWWQVYWGPCFSSIGRRLRREGIPVVFLCHNVTEHETAWWKRSLTRRVLSLGSGHVVQSNADRTQLFELLPSARPIVHLLPAFDQFPPALGALRREHELELLFFGFVRPYKGLDLLLSALALVPRTLDLRLTVAGEFWHGSAETRELVTELAIGDRTEIVDRYLSEQDVAEYFARAHAIVLPYRSATGSAVLALAQHYEKPVVVTRVGGLPDVVDDGFTGFVIDPDSPSEIADAIERLAASNLEDMGKAVRHFKAERLTWTGLANAVLEAAGLS